MRGPGSEKRRKRMATIIRHAAVLEILSLAGNAAHSGEMHLTGDRRGVGGAGELGTLKGEWTSLLEALDCRKGSIIIINPGRV